MLYHDLQGPVSAKLIDRRIIYKAQIYSIGPSGIHRLQLTGTKLLRHILIKSVDITKVHGFHLAATVVPHRHF